MTAYGTVETAVRAMKLGAIDFLEKPVDLDDLFALAGSLTGGDGESFALAGLKLPGVAIRDPGCAAKSWPNYFEVLERL